MKVLETEPWPAKWIERSILKYPFEDGEKMRHVTLLGPLLTRGAGIANDSSLPSKISEHPSLGSNSPKKNNFEAKTHRPFAHLFHKDSVT